MGHTEASGLTPAHQKDKHILAIHTLPQTLPRTTTKAGGWGPDTLLVELPQPTNLTSGQQIL